MSTMSTKLCDGSCDVYATSPVNSEGCVEAEKHSIMIVSLITFDPKAFAGGHSELGEYGDVN